MNMVAVTDILALGPPAEGKIPLEGGVDMVSASKEEGAKRLQNAGASKRHRQSKAEIDARIKELEQERVRLMEESTRHCRKLSAIIFAASGMREADREAALEASKWADSLQFGTTPTGAAMVQGPAPNPPIPPTIAHPTAQVNYVSGEGPSAEGSSKRRRTDWIPDTVSLSYPQHAPMQMQPRPQDRGHIQSQLQSQDRAPMQLPSQPQDRGYMHLSPQSQDRGHMSAITHPRPPPAPSETLPSMRTAEGGGMETGVQPWYAMPSSHETGIDSGARREPPPGDESRR
ncbi:uncharacterized protein DNG_03927 [Cephalotrichum gorgonifer]|uniref:BZIP domain-containing protein n=1 Tax=Cephalotrichum gorgonifer TaxID=2041049 RepID=A0AAE8MXT7_9PEZI|nr:uncharacterized protein DNG_03927 [Cephalotrichum gorgonifer]